MILENKIYYAKVYMIYREILTIKQQQIFELYFDEDMSINEIATELEITKTAVYNTIKKLMIKLDDLEGKIGYLKLKEKYEKLSEAK